MSVGLLFKYSIPDENSGDFLASEIIQKIKEGDPHDYVREVFMTSRTLKYVTEQINKLESCPR